MTVTWLQFAAGALLVVLAGVLLRALSAGHLLTVFMTILLTALAVSFMVNRSRKALGKMGYDSLVILLGYIAAVAVLFFMRTG